MEKKISTETLNRVNAGLGIAGGVLTLTLAVFQIVQIVKAVRANKKAAKEE